MTDDSSPAEAGSGPADSNGGSGHGTASEVLLPFRLVTRPPPSMTAPLVATLVGGLLIAIEGAWLSGLGSSSVLLVVSPASNSVRDLGGVGVILGVVIMALGTALPIDPNWSHGLGAAIVLLGTCSLAVGGGFWVGLGLTLAGGLMALTTPMTQSYGFEPVVPGQSRRCPECGVGILNPGEDGWLRCRVCGYSPKDPDD